MKIAIVIAVYGFFTFAASAATSILILVVVLVAALAVFRLCTRPDANAVFCSMRRHQRRLILAQLNATAKTEYRHPGS